MCCNGEKKYEKKGNEINLGYQDEHQARQNKWKNPKVVVLGKESTGKTSIIERYINNSFNDVNAPTLGAAFNQKIVQLQSKDQMKMYIWDTAGQEKYRSLAPIYYRQAQGILLVFDLTLKESLKEIIERWSNDIIHQVDEDFVVFLIGNKCDLKNERQVDSKEALSIIEEYGGKYIEVSAKQGNNIEKIFQEMSEEIFHRYALGKRRMLKK